MKSIEIDKYTRLGIIFLSVSLVWVYIFAAAIHSVMPVNAITQIPFANKLKIVTWFPQGWGFFSKNPREPQFKVVNISNEAVAVAWPNNIPENFFGLKRFGRSQGIEAGYLVSKIPETHKKDCTENPYSCLKESEASVEIENQTSLPTLCGDIGFVFQEPVPWAWSGNRENIEMPSKVMRVTVKCSGK
ncbi:SdpA family antimicrobial peptide system protein [Paenibacillus elgii]|uniref:SdpA family antimicrobial peptide system protein n=1 Tax=Paenibacillus elgii TaxID=189691 RepID=UPI002040E6CA|nr:SdpA family antimicrobial peptide system protein [Paenibacillus elgii]MCM3269767.1 SdpA family antimicrobial peptide system protein [Paenibacillus elgii]